MKNLQIVIHRVNERSKLKDIPQNYGVEIDIRAYGNKLILQHEPFCDGEDFIYWLEEYKNSLLVVNIKEAGIENTVINILNDKGITNFFLLDVEFPYIYRASRQGEKRIAMRFSEDESIETVLKYKNKVDWIWIDTISKLPLNKSNIKHIRSFKSCLVCPERWGRPQDIIKYKTNLINLNFELNSVMTNMDYAHLWSKF